ncbi:DUF2141 domain-containing protein [Croceitalea sp. P059]|uniref:DUF2141 domain-containing protein n=1 Tax=Croceitalea sp. P059 TaxID=3075601 RepID=UPI0028837DF1|nr:DUF2141 domain-containing protein [Croceitalea sp. P059]MDT0538959.1 DUF2141 domain-containing protein [Croceitalea sp. P059]
MKIIFSSFLLISSICFAQHKITVHVEQVPSSKGKVSVAVYESHETFLEFDKVFASGSAKAKEGRTTVEVDEIPNGEYAIALFYDENGNDELDTNWFGIPKEKVAFSHAKMRAFGPPKFKDCAFEVAKDVQVTISL